MGLLDGLFGRVGPKSRGPIVTPEFSLAIPEGWRQLPDEAPGLWRLASDDGAFAASVTVLNQLDPDLTLERYVQTRLEAESTQSPSTDLSEPKYSGAELQEAASYSGFDAESGRRVASVVLSNRRSIIQLYFEGYADRAQFNAAWLPFADGFVPRS